MKSKRFALFLSVFWIGFGGVVTAGATGGDQAPGGGSLWSLETGLRVVEVVHSDLEGNATEVTFSFGGATAFSLTWDPDSGTYTNSANGDSLAICGPDANGDYSYQFTDGNPGDAGPTTSGGTARPC